MDKYSLIFLAREPKRDPQLIESIEEISIKEEIRKEIP
jgi:hypothetical protein